MPPLRKDHPLAGDEQYQDRLEMPHNCKGCGMDLCDLDLEDGYAKIVPGIGLLCEECEGTP